MTKTGEIAFLNSKAGFSMSTAFLSSYVKKKLVLKQLYEMDPALFFEKALMSLDDNRWIQRLQINRGKGRNDYPIQTLWHQLLKALAYKMPALSDLASLEAFSPSASAFSRFIGVIEKELEVLDEMILSLADISPCIALGSLESKEERISFLVDTQTALPFLWYSGPLEESSHEQALKLLKKNPFQHSQYLLASSEYERLAPEIWRKFKIKPIIPRHSYSLDKKAYRNITYDDYGQVYCDAATMVYAGFEESRKTLKFRCAAEHYGYRCASYDHCTLRTGMRIPLETDPETFTPLPRFSYRWERLYAFYEQMPFIKALMRSMIPRMGRSAVYYRLVSLLYAAVHRTEKCSKFD